MFLNKARYIILLLLPLLSLHFSRTIADRALNSYSKVVVHILSSEENPTVVKRELSREEVATIDRLMSGLKRTGFQFVNYPELRLLCYKDSGAYRTVSIFYDEGLVYYGDPLRAFTERMHDKSSKCYIMTDELKLYLKRYID